MKILYLITQSSWGGAQKYVFELAQALQNENEIVVACGGKGELAEKLKQENIKIISLKYLKRDISFYSDIKAYFEIKKMLKSEKPDIAHLNSSKAGILGSFAARKLPIKVIYTVHGAVFTAAFNKMYRMIFKFLEKWTAKYKDKIIIVSENDKRLWLANKLCNKEKLVTIYNGINLKEEENFLAKEKALMFLTKQFDDLNGKRVIGSIANFYAEKNIFFLISSFKKLIQEKEDLMLVIIGDGRERKKIEICIQEKELQGRVLLLGFIENASQYLKAFDIFVLPSKKEGFPFVLLEAFLAKVPIIASDVGGIPEMVTDEKTGLLFEVNNEDKFIMQIKKLLADVQLKNQLVENGYVRVKERFSFNDFITKTKRVYGEVTSSEGS